MFSHRDNGKGCDVQVTLKDWFEFTGEPLNSSTMATYVGGDPAYTTNFSPILDSLTIDSAASDIIVGDTLTVDGKKLTITGLGEANVMLYHGDPFVAGTVQTNGAIMIIHATDGVMTRSFAAEPDMFNYPLNDAEGNALDITHIQLWNLETRSYISSGWFAKDDPDRLHAVCFAAGTMIETAAGPRPVQSLRVGDLVLTRDNGMQPLRWLGGRRLSGADLSRAPQLAPIRIAAGALGPGQPRQDLTLSPQHRLLLRTPIAARMAGASEVLAAAVHLLDLPGVARLAAPRGVAYWHMMFDRHEIVFANGAEAETLYLGPMARQALSPEALAEILMLFPDLADERGAALPMARPALKGGQVRKLVERQVRNSKPLVAPLPLC